MCILCPVWFLKSCLISLMFGWWLNRDFLKCLQPVNLPVFSIGFRVYSRGTVYNCVSLHCLLAQILKVIQRWERRAFSILPWECSQPCPCSWLNTCMWSLWLPVIRQSFSKPLWTIYSLAFLFKLFGWSAYTSTSIAILGNYNVKLLSMMVFSQFLCWNSTKAANTGQALSQVN